MPAAAFLWVALALAGSEADPHAHESFDLAAQCDSNVDCAPYPGNPWCDDNGSCYQCTDDRQCRDADEICDGGGCVTPCVDATDCTSQQPQCDAAKGHCVQCMDHTECAAAEYCAGDYCVPDACEPGEHRCREGSYLEVCDAAGAVWSVVVDCSTDGGTCEIIDSVSQCVAGEGAADESTGGAGEASTGDDGGAAGGGETASEAGGATDETGAADDSSAVDDAGGCRVDRRAPISWTWLGLLMLGWGRRRRASR